MYRLTRKAKVRRRSRPDMPPEDQRPAHWKPSLVRRTITVVDNDGPTQEVHTIELRRCGRIDCYDAYVDGELWAKRIGWSRVLSGLRKALPRVAAEHYTQP